MPCQAELLRNDVFVCEQCAELGPFKRSPHNGRLYKFPPIIGAKGEAGLLFIGINPRRSGTNLELHHWLTESADNFASLACNRRAKGEAYIEADGKEEHYQCHMIVIEGLFGAGTKF